MSIYFWSQHGSRFLTEAWLSDNPTQNVAATPGLRSAGRSYRFPSSLLIPPQTRVPCSPSCPSQRPSFHFHIHCTSKLVTPFRAHSESKPFPHIHPVSPSAQGHPWAMHSFPCVLSRHSTAVWYTPHSPILPPIVYFSS